MFRPAPKTATVLVVDDTPENLTLLGQLLSPHYRVQVAPSGRRALQITASSPHPDLVLLDVMMPEMNGYEVMAALKEDPATRDIPVIFVTAMTDSVDEEKGLACGAVDYITKPISPPIVLARVATQVEVKKARDWLSNQNAYLESEVERRLHDNQKIQDIAIRALASLAEARDHDTGRHVQRTQAYVEVLARHLGAQPRFAACLSESMIRMIVKSAPLHDIGKVGIPDAVLLKPGQLDETEIALMKSHCRIGSDAIEQAIRGELSDAEYRALQRHSQLGGDVLGDAMQGLDDAPLGFLAVARNIAMWHHENWDGSGYPDGLAGEEIPLPARLMALADTFDALVSRRVYKPAMPIQEAIDMIVAGRGSHFDPDVVDAFLANIDRFTAILADFSDNSIGDAPVVAPVAVERHAD
ncbi:MAG: two-component system response regulator [Gammaproteobacteria bacterium]|nr:two-component system response regulator [Gammaproteobacteria bacterium]